jgi:hypothetical protein
MCDNQNPEALRKCVAALQSAGERQEATEALCVILIGHVARQRSDLQAAYAALAVLETVARSKANPVQQQAETWFSGLIR